MTNHSALYGAVSAAVLIVLQAPAQLAATPTPKRLVADGQIIDAPSGVAVRGRKVTDLSGRGWTLDGARVEIPHTWNAQDGADGVGRPNGDSASARSYARRRGVYRRALSVSAKPGRRCFVRCLGASQKAVVKVNGTEIGRHVGAYTAFCFEATKFLKKADNVLEIEMDNLVDGDVPPVQADFTVFGGLYRGVEMIETERICIDCVTDGASGVRIDADPDTGNVVAYISVDGGTNETRRFSFPDRRLWSPEDPALYTLDITVSQGGCTDTVKVPFGFRKAEFREDGFYLNGVKRKIRGVNMHQDMANRGWAVSPARHARDIATMKEMGADGLRTAHYPHAGDTYGECDRQGLLVWCEYPNVNNFGVTETYRRRALDGVREMIAQLRNHPSIVAWSVANEYRTNSVVSHAWLKRVVGDLAAEAKRLDPSRATAAATCRSFLSDINAIPDILGFNFYPGWYRREANEMKETIDAALAETRRASIGVTEYGAGGNIDSHASPDARNAPLSPFHAEEYQAWVHRFNYEGLRDDPRVWGTFVWAMFDFGADARREGSQFGMNDKGLVCYDHETKKDAFFFYKANWTSSPVLHLVGKRAKSFTNEFMTVMAFWNGEGPVSLKVNGRDVGSLAPDEFKTAIWRGVRLEPGFNDIEVSAGGMVEKARWGRRVAASPENVPALMSPGTTKGDWESSRRPEIVRTAFEAEYGVRPVERPADLRFTEIAPAEKCFGGTAVRKRVKATFSGPGGKGSMVFSVWIPLRTDKAPVFVHSSPRPAETAADPDAPRPVYLLPAEAITRRGYAAVAYCNQDVCYDAWEGPEFHDRGVFSIYGTGHMDSRGSREWGILSAWAWGVSRIVDWIETEPLLDASKIAVVGLSRNGKAAIVAGASDPRIALTVSCCSGCGGAKLNHISLPFSESIDRIYPHHRWFARGFFDWRGRDRELPWDQHQILALVAPRLLYVSSAESDVWAGPDGEFHSARLASPAWGLYGRKGIAQDARPPRLNEPMHDGSVGYHRRAGRHAILAYDWERYMDFAERNGWK